MFLKVRTFYHWFKLLYCISMAIYGHLFWAVIFETNIRYVTEWQIVVGLNNKMWSVLVFCVSRPLDLSPFRCGASAEISSHSSTKSTIIFTHSTSQRSGQVSEVIGQCSGFICFILPFCFLARSPNKQLISHYDDVAQLREGWQQLAQPIRLKVWLDERVTIETVGFSVEHCLISVNIWEFQWSHLCSFWLNVDKSS